MVQLLDQLVAVLSDRVATVSLVIVDDGSLPPISECHLDRLKDKFPGYILTLKRSVGHQRAIADIAYVVENKLADILVVMDADGEDEPADVPRLLAAMSDHGPTIVVAERTKRREGVVFRTFYLLYRMIFFLLTGRRIKFGNFLVLPSALARGAGADDRRVLYNWQSLKEVFEDAGFDVKLLEYFDASGRFHYANWDPVDGKILRSSRFDERNFDRPLAYTSIILDATKIDRLAQYRAI
jgi:glycosyltransferase involved in cell wall biosynthesis